MKSQQPNFARFPGSERISSTTPPPVVPQTHPGRTITPGASPIYKPGVHPVQQYRSSSAGLPPPVYRPALPAAMGPPPIYKPINATQPKMLTPPKIVPQKRIGGPLVAHRHAPQPGAIQRMQQPLISNYIPRRVYVSDRRRLYQWRTTSGFADLNAAPIDPENVSFNRINDFEYEAKDGNRVVGELVLYEDNQGTFWINFVQVPQYAQRKGIASRLLQMAIDDHGTIYASLQGPDEDDENDTRHLSPDGDALVRGCRNKGMRVTMAMPNGK